MPGFLFSLHAREQILKRNISEEQVLETVNSVRMEGVSDNVSIYQRFFLPVGVPTNRKNMVTISVGEDTDR